MSFKLVVFDLDGVLVEPTSSWVWVHKHYGTNNDKTLESYNRGEIDDHQFMRSDIALWRSKKDPIHYQDVADILDQVPIMPGAKELLDAIHNSGARTAIISGGLIPLAKRVGNELGIDMVFANDLSILDNGELEGEGILQVKLRDKGSPFMDLLEELDIPAENVAAVGNSHIDIPMLEAAGLGIAFNPADDEVIAAGDAVVREQDLRRLLPILGL